MKCKAMTRHSIQARLCRWAGFWREFSRHRVPLVSLCVVVFIAGIAVVAPWLPLHDPMEFLDDQYAPPGSNYLMGTDNYGRSVLSRVIWGTRLALAVGLGSAGISMGLGIILGGIAGYYGGWLDDVLSRTFDIFLLIPAFFLAMSLIALFGPSIYFIVFVIGITMWPRSARIMRSQTLTLKARTFVQAMQVSGASHPQILFLHVIPNGLTPVITYGTVLMGSAILIEAGLSFLGLGDPSTVSWGRLIYEGQKHLRVAPWMSLFPGLAMLLVVGALNLVGDGLNYVLNPHLQGRTSRTQSAVPEESLLTVSEANSKSTWNQPERHTPVLLDVQDVKMYYALADVWVHAVDGISFRLEAGSSLGLVGESGCGKSSLGLTLMRVLPRNAQVLAGNVYLAGQEVLRASERMFQEVRWNRMSMIFQSSMNSLDPVKRVGEQLTDAYQLHQRGVTHQEALDRVKELFNVVGIPTNRIYSYPHELSGGMRQRVMISLALLLEPEVIIADEPTTALDVLVQDQILAELDRLREQMDLSMILISHDVGIVAETCDRIAIMYAGQIVEEAPSSTLLRNPRHPYSRGLLGSLPTLTGPRKELISLSGQPPSCVGEIRGCRFAPRCPLVTDLCRTIDPPQTPVNSGHWSRCHYALNDKIESAWAEETTR